MTKWLMHQNPPSSPMAHHRWPSLEYNTHVDLPDFWVQYKLVLDFWPHCNTVVCFLFYNSYLERSMSAMPFWNMLVINHTASFAFIPSRIIIVQYHYRHRKDWFSGQTNLTNSVFRPPRFIWKQLSCGRGPWNNYCS